MVYVGDVNQQVITVHRNQQTTTLQVSIQPIHLACDRVNRIWVSDWQVRKVVVIDESNGNEVCSIGRFSADGKVGVPDGQYCLSQ